MSHEMRVLLVYVVSWSHRLHSFHSNVVILRRSALSISRRLRGYYKRCSNGWLLCPRFRALIFVIQDRCEISPLSHNTSGLCQVASLISCVYLNVRRLNIQVRYRSPESREHFKRTLSNKCRKHGTQSILCLSVKVDRTVACDSAFVYFKKVLVYVFMELHLLS